MSQPETTLFPASFRRTYGRLALAASAAVVLATAAAGTAEAKGVVVLEHAGAGALPSAPSAPWAAPSSAPSGSSTASPPASPARSLGPPAPRRRRPLGLRRPRRSRSTSQAPTTTVPGTSLAVAGAAVRTGTVGSGGAGVDVALVDSGVSPVAGLDAPGKVVDGPDLSADATDPDKAHLDGFGHGTHLAGAIAGNDAASGFAEVAPVARGQRQGRRPRRLDHASRACSPAWTGSSATADRNGLNDPRRQPRVRR